MPPVDQLVRRSAEGDIQAWRQLLETYENDLLAMAGKHWRMRRKGLAHRPDDVAQVRLKTLEILSAKDFANLKSYLGQDETDAAKSMSFDQWLRGTVDIAVKRYIREKFGVPPKPLAEGETRPPQPSKVDLHSRAGRLDDEVERGFLHTLGMTARLTSAEIFACIEAEFTPDEARAMKLYYNQGSDFAAIAEELGLESAKEADAMIRRLNARLRYRFN